MYKYHKYLKWPEKYLEFNKVNYFKSIEIKEARWVVYIVEVKNWVSTVVPRLTWTDEINSRQMKCTNLILTDHIYIS